MRNNKSMYRKENFNIVSIVKNKDKIRYLDFLCNELDLNFKESKEFKRNFKFEKLSEIDYLKFIEFVKDYKKILIKVNI